MKKDEIEILTCEDCGSLECEETICPYDEDVNGIQTEVVLCEKCKELRADEI